MRTGENGCWFCGGELCGKGRWCCGGDPRMGEKGAVVCGELGDVGLDGFGEPARSAGWIWPVGEVGWYGMYESRRSISAGGLTGYGGEVVLAVCCGIGEGRCCVGAV